MTFNMEINIIWLYFKLRCGFTLKITRIKKNVMYIGTILHQICY